jgi:hypothetical protein
MERFMQRLKHRSGAGDQLNRPILPPECFGPFNPIFQMPGIRPC